jgi:hypothetical protein
MGDELVTFRGQHGGWGTGSVHAHESSGVLEFPRNRWHDSYGLIDLSRQSSRTSSFIDTIESGRETPSLPHEWRRTRDSRSFYSHYRDALSCTRLSSSTRG